MPEITLQKYTFYLTKKMYLCRRFERGAERLRSDPLNLMRIMPP